MKNFDRIRDMDYPEIARELSDVQSRIANIRAAIDIASDRVAAWNERLTYHGATFRYSRLECEAGLERATRELIHYKDELALYRSWERDLLNEQYHKSPEFWHRKTRTKGY